jgi:dTMP kinase
VDVKEGLRRRERDGGWNRLDAYEVAFHQRVRQGYIELVQAEPQRWLVIDAGQPPDQVQMEIRRIVLERLQDNH